MDICYFCDNKTKAQTRDEIIRVRTSTSAFCAHGFWGNTAESRQRILDFNTYLISAKSARLIFFVQKVMSSKKACVRL